MLLLYTGQRRNNVLSMKFSDIDLFSSTWTIPAEEFKNKETHKVQLYPDAIKIIRRRYEALKDESKYLFPSPVKKGTHVVEIKRQWSAFLDAANLKDVTRHDMRRTAGSILLMMTGNLKLVQKFLGHKDISTTAKVYSKFWEQKESEAINNAFDKVLNA